jgi:predicted alpha/beta-fold hydrolase
LHGGDGSGPLILLIHGLTGCADSFYVRATAHALLTLGYAVLRLDLRDHAGRSDDLRAVLTTLAAQFPRLVEHGIAAIGYSLGGNLLLKYLGEEGRTARLAAAVAVSAPIDLAAASQRIMAARNRFYHSYLLVRMRGEALARAGQRAIVPAVRSIYEYDDRIVAPANGFAGADDYYRRCSAGQYLGGIATPTLIVHALDDPWIPADAYVTARRAPGAATLLLPSAGGHVGFHGTGSRVPWHDRCAALFLASVLGAPLRPRA